jgi:hypothetical protein
MMSRFGSVVLGLRRSKYYIVRATTKLHPEYHIEFRRFLEIPGNAQKDGHSESPVLSSRGKIYSGVYFQVYQHIDVRMDPTMLCTFCPS